MMQEEFEGIIISFSVWMEKQVALQGGECEVSEVKNVGVRTGDVLERAREPALGTELISAMECRLCVLLL